MKTFHSYSEVSACVGQEVAVTDWITITQEQVNLFAQATGDHQWIHVDPERAKAGPFGAPIAHGFLTLSLIPRFFEGGMRIEGARMGVNYGLNRVRFTAPVPVGSRLRARLELQATEPLAPDGLQMTWLVTVEREGADYGCNDTLKGQIQGYEMRSGAQQIDAFVVGAESATDGFQRRGRHGHFQTGRGGSSRSHGRRNRACRSTPTGTTKPIAAIPSRPGLRPTTRR